MSLVRLRVLSTFVWRTKLGRELEVQMSDLVEELAKKARSLPPEDRVRLAEELLATVQETDEHVEAAWEEEIRRRVAEIENGTAKLVPADEVFAEVRRLIK